MARSGLLTPKLIETLVQEYMATLLDQDKRDRYGVTENALDDAALQMNNDFRDRYQMDHRKDYEMLDEETGEVEEVSGARNLASYHRLLAMRFMEQGRKQDHSEIAPVASTLLAIEKVQASPDSPEFRMFCDALLAKEVEVNEVFADRAERGLSNPYDKSVTATPARRKKLSALMIKYLEVHEGNWEPGSERKMNDHFNKILELTGNPYTDEISQDMLVDLFKALSKYPTYRNHSHLKGLTLEQCLEHPKYKPINSTSLSQTWFALGSLLTYGSENGEYGIARNFCGDKVS
jgi:DNA primase